MPPLEQLADEAFELVRQGQTDGLMCASPEVQTRDYEDFFRQIRQTDKRCRVVADRLREFLKKYSQPQAGKPDTVQAARLCAFENEKGIVFVSAAVVATIIARCEGDSPIVLGADIPVFWIAEQDMIQVVGSGSWDEAIRRLGYNLVSIPVHDWSDERALAAIRQIFPTAELQSIDSIDETAGP